MRWPMRPGSPPRCPANQTILVNLSGRGDKDMHTVAQRAGREL